MSDRFAGGIKAGSTGVSIPIILRKTADNTELTGQVAANLTASYRRAQSASVAIPAADLATVSDAWTAGGWKETDPVNRPGEYRFDVPDAAFATGVDHVTIAIKAAGAYVFYERFALESVGSKEVYDRIGAAGAGLTAVAQASSVTAIQSQTDKLQYDASNNVKAVSSGLVKLSSDGLDNIVVETGVNARQALSPILAAAAGVLAGAATTTVTIAAGNQPSVNRITATVDSSGNRSAVTLNLPA